MLHLFLPLISSGLASYGIILIVSLINKRKLNLLSKTNSINRFFIWVIFSNIFYSIYFFTISFLYKAIVVGSPDAERSLGSAGGYFVTESTAHSFTNLLYVADLIIFIVYAAILFVGYLYWKRHKVNEQRERMKFNIGYFFVLLILSLISALMSLMFFVAIISGEFSVSYGG